MILTKNLNIKIINHNLEHYKSLGYNVHCGDIINVSIDQLTKGSHYLVEVECDKCHSIKKIKYQDYIKITKNNTQPYYCQLCVKSEKTKKTVKSKYNVENISQSDIIKKKKEKTNLENWKVKNVFQNTLIKNKIIKTNIEKYGTPYPIKSDIIKLKSLLKRIENGKQINPIFYTDYSLYRKKVLSVTRKFKNELFENWNGMDYYDNQYIKDYFNLNKNDSNYPTIDHKISIFYGFKNNIDYKIIGNINNLCITKKYINSSKCIKNEEEYKK